MKIEAYMLSNGEIVDNKELAEKKQKELDFQSKVNHFAEKYGYYEGKDQIREAILENADELLEILKGRP